MLKSKVVNDIGYYTNGVSKLMLLFEGLLTTVELYIHLDYEL